MTPHLHDPNLVGARKFYAARSRIRAMFPSNCHPEVCLRPTASGRLCTFILNLASRRVGPAHALDHFAGKLLAAWAKPTPTRPSDSNKSAKPLRSTACAASLDRAQVSSRIVASIKRQSWLRPWPRWDCLRLEHRGLSPSCASNADQFNVLFRGHR